MYLLEHGDHEVEEDNISHDDEDGEHRGQEIGRDCGHAHLGDLVHLVDFLGFVCKHGRQSDLTVCHFRWKEICDRLPASSRLALYYKEQQTRSTY